MIAVSDLKRAHGATWAAGDNAAVAERIDETPPRDLLARVELEPGRSVRAAAPQRRGRSLPAMFKHILTTSHLRRALIAACAVIALAPAAAQAAPGDLKYEGCFTDQNTLGCLDLPFNPQVVPSDVATSPDGKSVYVTSLGSDSVLHYFRGPDGTLAYDGCVGNGNNGCADLEGDPMRDPTGVAVSPDGKSVYVVATSTGSILRFDRLAPDGQIVFASCLSDVGDAPCGNLDGAPLTGAFDVTVSPDGNSVYVTSSGTDTLSHFFRDEAGRISYGGCVGNKAGHNCEDVPFEPLDSPRGVAVSPDGKSVYVASVRSESVSHFFRAPQGQITFAGCVHDSDAQNCATAAGLAEASDVAVSPDGKSVYATGLDSDAVVHFTRLAPDGQIVPNSCLSGTAEPGCDDLPGKPMHGPVDITIAPDGTTAYVASLYGQVIARLALQPADGTPTFAGCVATTNDSGCPIVQSSVPFAANSLAISPDQRSLYATVSSANALARFSFEQPGGGGNGGNGGDRGGGANGGGPGGPGGTPADRVKPRISGLRASVRRRVPTFRFRLSEAATVRVVVQRAKRRVTVGRPLVRSARAGVNRLAFGKRRLAAGRYRVRVVATDASGNRSAAKTARFRVK
jgi:DNA-binding beta-propeller fold protein YncE